MLFIIGAHCGRSVELGETNAPAASVRPNDAVADTNAAENLPTGSLVSATPRPKRPVVPAIPVAPPGFQIESGFRLELVASEPLISSPTAMAFDENGRLFVVEGGDSNDPVVRSARTGRIRVLEDTLGDGKFDSSTIFADELEAPSAIACYDGGVFVAAGSELLYLKAPRNGGPVERRVIFSGFGGTNTSGASGPVHNLNWGLDNRIHGATAGWGGVIRLTNTAGAAFVSLAGSDFSFDPRELTIAPEGGPAQSGMTFDNHGRKFWCDLTHPLRTLRYNRNYIARNPFFPAPSEIVDVASPATPIIRFAPAGPARGGTNSDAAPARSMAVASAWLLNARGCVSYRGSAFPTNYLENVFVADATAHVIHRMIVRRDGLTVSALRPPGETDREFLASTDSVFQPWQMINGPDGALYVADLHGGGERGRIYRIVPERFLRPRPPRLGGAGTRDLVTALASPNGWQRDTAARLLFERHDLLAANFLVPMLNVSRLPLARLHALHALAGLGDLHEISLLQALRDPDETLREHALRLVAEQARGGQISGSLWEEIRGMFADPSLWVQYQLAFTLGDLDHPEKAAILSGIIARDPENTAMRTAVLSSLSAGADDLLVLLARDAQFYRQPGGLAFLRQLARLIGIKGSLEEVKQTLDLVDEGRLSAPTTFAALSALGGGLHDIRSSLALVDGTNRMERFYVQAQAMAAERRAPVELRVDAIRLLGVSSLKPSDFRSALLPLLGQNVSEELKSAVVTTLVCDHDALSLDAVIQRWGSFSPSLARTAAAAMLSRDDHGIPVLRALESGRIPAAEFPAEQVNFLRTHREKEARERAAKLFGLAAAPHPELEQQLHLAASLAGLPDIGRSLFVANCVECHRFKGEGREVGPNLAAAKIMGKDKLLRAIFEPHHKIRAEFATSVIHTRGGDNFIGIITNENLASITLQQPNQPAIVLPRANIESIQTEPWSLMPEGATLGLGADEMSSLLAYLMKAGG
jgi:putative membrane-bound dehydrogenase-like protein